MKFILIHLFILNVPIVLFGQWDPIKEFNSRKFPCDSGVTTLDITFCSGYKNEFADSLLNKLYKKIIASVDKDISENKKDLLIFQKKKSKSSADSTDIESVKLELDHNQRYKTSIINSQRTWLKLRSANSDFVSINCEGGRECNAIIIQADTNEILERIKKLMTICYSCYYDETPSR